MKILTCLSAIGAIALTACQPAPAHSAAEQPARPQVAMTATNATLEMVAIGASDVAGIGATDPATEGWAPVLASLLPRPVKLLKLGEPGDRASQLREAQLAQAVAASPDMVVLWTGPNDFNGGVDLARFEADLQAMLAALEKTGARLVVLNLPEIHRLPAFRDHHELISARLPQWQAAVRRLGTAHGATVIDLAAYAAEVEANPHYLSADGFHPSTAGYARIAQIIAASIHE